jgi:hypothetical protein
MALAQFPTVKETNQTATRGGSTGAQEHKISSPRPDSINRDNDRVNISTVLISKKKYLYGSMSTSPSNRKQCSELNGNHCRAITEPTTKEENVPVRQV